MMFLNEPSIQALHGNGRKGMIQDQIKHIWRVNSHQLSFMKERDSATAKDQIGNDTNKFEQNIAGASKPNTVEEIGGRPSFAAPG